MRYFGEPPDALERLADDIEMSAHMYPSDVGKAMRYLANELLRLHPLYDVLSSYCENVADDTDVEVVFHKLTASNNR